MKIQNGQHNDIIAKFPNYDREKSEIIAEGGNDNGKTFHGKFMVKVYRYGVHMFEDGKYVRKVK